MSAQDLGQYVPAVRQNGVRLNANEPLVVASTVSAEGNILPKFEEIQVSQLGATTTSFTLFVNDNVSGTWKVAGVTAVFGTASTSGTLQVEVATGTQAVGSGTNQLTGTVSLSGTANTAVNGTVVASPTTIAAGNRVNLIFAGTMTSLANCAITVVLQRLS